MAFEIVSVNPAIIGVSAHRNHNIFKDLFYNYSISHNMSRIKKVDISTYSFYFSQDKFYNY
jgi:hypothetical protein